MRYLPIMFVLLSVTWADAETVDVKYRGSVDLKPFTCQDITRSSVVNRLCYDASNQYVIVQLKTTYYHYCEMPKSVVDEWLAADSMGRYYNAKIKGTGKDGPYDCRTHRVPAY
ncbi:KTSC domain-containing protein [Bradyrhizobium rifense]|uniref:KTSC domain-containing protein n=1 Tax=Bradyrhizobium rifense TaxID=515499 RepID=A0A5D3KK65_9BRAD|nr:KTSC domain-containing protein [Bradyrhizobium rifense]TYL95951.1 KTSC domain-containing protein [Bradyrhizobium rifense]